MPERTDIHFGRMLWLAVALVVTCALIATAVWFAFPRAGRHARKYAASGGPRLQARPTDDLARLRAEDRAKLHSYGWVDRPAGVIRIPIERAMELTAP